MKPVPGRSLRGFSRVVIAAVVIVIALLAPAAAGAKTATLVLEDVCEDPSNVFDYQWASVRFGATTLYLMARDGTVRLVSTTGGDINGFEDLYVFAHGGGGTIGGMAYAAFVAALEDAHPAIPNSVSFGVCASAVPPNSLLKRVNDEYGENVNRLEGGVVACALTGNGSRDLSTASYRIRVVRSNQRLYDQILDNIVVKFAGNYPGTAVSYAQYCRSALAPFNAARLRDFIATVLREFSRVSGDPETSTNYLDLVALNTNGDPLTVCGQDPTGTGPVACP
jgi:hypothetical protein